MNYPELAFSFEEMGDLFKAELRLVSSQVPPQSTPQSPPQITLLECKILRKLAASPSLASKDLASELAISADTAREYIVRLKSRGWLVREGARRYGLWIVTETGKKLLDKVNGGEDA